MTIMEEDEEEKKRNRPNLHLITGGRGSDDDWISSLPVGTSFSFKDKGQFLVVKAEILSRSKRGLIKLLFLEPEITITIEPKEFCKQKDLLEIND